MRIRFARARDLALGAGIALVAAVALDALGRRSALDDVCVGTLFGLGVGLGIFALGVWQRGRARA